MPLRHLWPVARPRRSGRISFAGQAIDSGAAAEKLARSLPLQTRRIHDPVEILEHKKAELRHKQSRGYLSELKAKIRDAFRALWASPSHSKRPEAPEPCADCRSQKGLPQPGPPPSRVHDRFDRSYRQNVSGSGCVGGLRSDRQGVFSGKLDHLRDIKRSVSLPTLNKEFMVDDIQFYEARAYGADAVLLIVAALERAQLVDFHGWPETSFGRLD